MAKLTFNWLLVSGLSGEAGLGDYELKSVTTDNSTFSITDNLGNVYLLSKGKVIKIDNEMVFSGNKFVLKNDALYINGIDTKLKCRSFDQLLYGLIVGQEKYVIWVNNLIDLKNMQVYPISEVKRICTGFMNIDGKYLITTPNALLFYDSKFRLVKQIEGYYPSLLKTEEGYLYIKIDKENVAKLSTDGIMLRKEPMFSNVFQAFFICDDLFFLQRKKDNTSNILFKNHERLF